MQSSRHRRHWLAVVAITATVGLGAGVLPHFATATTPHPRSLGSPVAPATLPSSLPAAPSPAACVTPAGCDLYAKSGTVTAGAVAGIPIWGFTFDSAAGTGELGGSANNTIIISDTDTLYITLHNDLPLGAGNLSLEVPAVQTPPDLVGAPETTFTTYTFGPLDPGTYVYQAGATAQQPRQLAMGLAAIIIVRPTGYSAAAPTAYVGGLGSFDDEALVVMSEIDPAFNTDPLNSDVEDYDPQYFFINGKAHPLTDDIAANAGDTVLLRAANLGIRDRALGLVNSRLTLIGEDSHQLAESHKVDLESKLLTPGQVADLTTLVDPSAPVGSQFALLDLNRHLNNDGEAGIGGLLTFIDVVEAPLLIGNPLVDRAYATDFPPEQIGGLDAVLVVLDDALPAGTLQTFETWNQATPGGSPNSSAGEQFRAHVLRPTGNPNEYDVVYTSAVQTVPAPAIAGVSELFSFPAGVAVQAGDVIGYFGSGVPVDITGTGTDTLVYPTLAAPATFDTITLGSATYPIYPQARTYSFGATVTPAGPPTVAATVTSLTPSTNDGTSDVTVDYTITGTATSADWFLDDLGGACAGSLADFSAGPHSVTISQVTLSACGAQWLTGDHVLWIQPANGSGPGSAGGDVFTLALQGPTVFDLSTDPEFANLSFNKTDANPPGSTDVLLYGSAQPSLLDRTIDDAEGCLSLPALPTDPCPVGDAVVVDWGDPAGPSHAQALSARILVGDFPTPNATNTVYVRVHETGGPGRWSGWGDPNSTVDVILDTVGPTVSGYVATPNPAGAGNHPGNLNFLESVRIQVDISDALSPIADAELFLYAPDADGTGSQLRPLAGQWLDDLNAPAHDRTAYLEVAMAELMSQPQGDVDVYIHAKDAAGNWGVMGLYTLQLDKTSPVILGTPVDVVGSHTFLPDETGMALAGGTITLDACDPNGVTVVVSCPLPAGVDLLGPPNTAVTSGIVEIRYHVAAITGQFGAAGAGIFYQTAQRTFGTITLNGDGTYSVSFDWHLVPQPPLPIEAASAVWVWAVDGAGNPSIPVEVPVGPPTP